MLVARMKNCLLRAMMYAVVTALVTPAASAQTDFDHLFDGRTINFDLSGRGVSERKSALERGNPRIDPAIRALVSQGLGLARQEFSMLAQSLAVPISSRREVAVAMLPERGYSGEELAADAEADGAEVSLVVDGVVFAQVPLEAVSDLGRSQALSYMGRQAVLRPLYPASGGGGAASDGVRAVHADRLHAAGITGKGVKVGILDFGFQRYGELLERGLLPPPAGVGAFNSTGDIETVTVHGTACAEIVHAMAPDAELYLAAVDGREDQILHATDWLAGKGVKIVSFSGGTHFGPHNGQSGLDRFIQMTSALRGLLWVNAAGNSGLRHWAGRPVDRNRDGWLELGPNGENFLVLQPSTDRLAVTVNWDDWGFIPYRPAANEDIDAYLFQYDPRTGSATQVGQSANPQRGRGAPVEHIAAPVARDRPFLLALRAARVTRPVLVHVYSDLPSRMAPVRPRASVVIPATGRSALSAGAVDVQTEILEDFSSQGPTDDGRLKPEVSAPDNTVSESYAQRGGRFRGTSAACPHVAGFAALLKQMHPEFGRKQLGRAVMAAVRAKGPVTPNQGYGHGYIDASLLELPTGQQGMSIDLPAAWGGQVTTSQLDEFLAGSGRDSSLDVRVATGRSEYRLGDGLKIGYTASDSCHFLLLARDSRGRYALIAPLKGGRARLSGGKKYMLPEGDDVILVSEPTGEDEVILIGSREPINIGRWRSGAEIAVSQATFLVVR